MARILLTAFEPYGPWEANSSWETLKELLRQRGTMPGVVTRRYPVDFQQLKLRLHSDLSQSFDAVIHLGQSPGATQVKLEILAVNVAGIIDSSSEEFGPLVEDGPLAFRSQLPVGTWTKLLQEHNIPAQLSYHAGTYLCNAAMYWSHYFTGQTGRSTKIGFVHLPLIPQQVIGDTRSLPSMSLETLVAAVGMMLDQLLFTFEADNALLTEL